MSDPSASDRREPPSFDPVGMLRWGWRMGEELRQLPDAIAQWREGVAMFLSVARRLDTATASAEELFAQVEESGLLDQLERLRALSLQLSRQAGVGGVAVGEQVLDETRRNLAAFSRMFAPPTEDG